MGKKCAQRVLKVLSNAHFDSEMPSFCAEKLHLCWPAIASCYTTFEGSIFQFCFKLAIVNRQDKSATRDC